VVVAVVAVAEAASTVARTVTCLVTVPTHEWRGAADVAVTLLASVLFLVTNFRLNSLFYAKEVVVGAGVEAAAAASSAVKKV
jgi:hypothetical protein